MEWPESLVMGENPVLPLPPPDTGAVEHPPDEAGTRVQVGPGSVAPDAELVPCPMTSMPFSGRAGARREDSSPTLVPAGPRELCSRTTPLGDCCSSTGRCRGSAGDAKSPALPKRSPAEEAPAGLSAALASASLPSDAAPGTAASSAPKPSSWNERDLAPPVWNLKTAVGLADKLRRGEPLGPARCELSPPSEPLVLRDAALPGDDEPVAERATLRLADRDRGGVGGCLLRGEVRLGEADAELDVGPQAACASSAISGKVNIAGRAGGDGEELACRRAPPADSSSGLLDSQPRPSQKPAGAGSWL